MSLEAFRLDGKVAIVTGAGRGLGEAIAIALAEAGADVVVAARTASALEHTAAQIRQRGRRGLAVPTDVTSMPQVEAMAQRTIAEFGHIDILVNNAGVAIEKPVLETSEEEWLQVIDTNLNSVYRCTHAIGRYMVAQRSGKVINVSSMLAVAGVANMVSYCASKAAIVLFTKALAVEWARYNIRVNAIAPGYFLTPLNIEYFANEDVRRRVERSIPLRRLGQPPELGPLVIYLASSASDYMTGETVFIDGGYSIR